MAEESRDRSKRSKRAGATAAKPHPAGSSADSAIRHAAELLPPLADTAFAAFIDRYASRARVVLLGEASHGSSEFYRARAQITRRLIEQHSFTLIAVAADWPDAAAIDRHVRHRPAAPLGRAPFERFPTWMWRNTDVADFVEWLRAHNASIRDATQQASFHGLDLYSLNASIGAVLDYLDRVDPQAARLARERHGCLSPWVASPERYGRAAAHGHRPSCEAEVVAMLRDLLDQRVAYMARDSASFFDAAQNARLVAAAERYYRAMYHGDSGSWNLRDEHMFATLERLLDARGPEAKAVVWAHNAHIGNAAATELGWRGGELNIGQLCRQRFGDAAVLIGFGTDHGTVAAASDWGAEMEIKAVRPARVGSYERLCHEAGVDGRFLLDLDPARQGALVDELAQHRLERGIGVIYRPETERWSHYFEAELPRQFDAFIWLDETSAVTPLPSAAPHGMPDTYPFGL